jgi:hypothetical protein
MMCWCKECDEQVDDCTCDRWVVCELCRQETYDADEMGIDPEEEFD